MAHAHHDLKLPREGHGDAVDSVYERPDGTLWVGNGEYGSQVNFCPVCGVAATKAVDPGLLPFPVRTQRGEGGHAVVGGAPSKHSGPGGYISICGGRGTPGRKP